MSEETGTLDFLRDLPPPEAPRFRDIQYRHGGCGGNISVETTRRFVMRIPAATLDAGTEEGHFSLAIRRTRDAMDHFAAA